MGYEKKKAKKSEIEILKALDAARETDWRWAQSVVPKYRSRTQRPYAKDLNRLIDRVDALSEPATRMGRVPTEANSSP